MEEGADKAEITDNFAAGDTKQASFGGITFSQPGTYTFDVTEEEGKAGKDTWPAGWMYDGSTKQITVTVTDEGFDGKLDAAVSDTPTFVNSYTATSAKVEGAKLTGTKTLVGRNALAGEEFTFELELTSDNAANVEGLGQNGTLTTSLKDLVDSKKTPFHFGDLTFNAAGTYTFSVSEVLPKDVGAPDYKENGLTYAHHVGTITVTVTDNDEGALVAEVTAENTDFENTYEPTPVTFGID